VITYQTTNACTDVEDSPEPGEIATLLRLCRVRHHDSALGGPEKTGTHTEQSTGEDVETGDIFMDRHQQTNGVNAVANSTEGESEADTKTVNDGTGEETDDCKGTVKSNVLFSSADTLDCEASHVGQYHRFKLKVGAQVK
jgi:hypothetical protein